MSKVEITLLLLGPLHLLLQARKADPRVTSVRELILPFTG